MLRMTSAGIGWLVNGGGHVSGTGLFTAGTVDGGPYTISATVGGVTGTATFVTQLVSPVTGDFDGNGVPDLVWQNDSTRQVTVWYMGGRQGNTFLGSNWLAGDTPGWTVVGAADFNGDGKPDLVWQNDSTRQVTVWHMGGSQGNTFLGWNWLAGNEVGWRAIAKY
jgi:hypothetical protein